MLAHIADIPQLKQAFDDGLDIHAMTASEMFGVPIEGMPSDVGGGPRRSTSASSTASRRSASPTNLSISREEAGDYIKTYFRRFPGIRDYMERTKAEAHDNGFVTTIFGRRMHFPEINTKNPSMRAFLERAAINAPIQGSAADIIRRAMVQMPGALAAAGLAVPHAAAGPRRTGVRGAGRRSAEAAEAGGQRDGEGAGAGAGLERAAEGGCEGRGQLGGGALGRGHSVSLREDHQYFDAAF